MRDAGPRTGCRLVRLVASILLAGPMIIAAIASPITTAKAEKAGNNAIYVLLLNPECDDDFREKFDYYMHLNNTVNERYFGYYEVVCLGGVTDLADVENYVLPSLRLTLPHSMFVFVYPESMAGQYSDYMAAKYGSQYRDAALGNTDIPNGIAYASEFPVTIKHEMQHLATCGTWHNPNGEDLGHIQKHPGAESLAWCSTTNLLNSDNPDGVTG